MPRKKKEEKKEVVKKSPKLENKLLENLIELQKIHTNLAEKFDGLSNEISQLLALFELAAKNFSKGAPPMVAESDKAFLNKIDKLLEQNKTIAKGLTLMEEQIRRKAYHSEQSHDQTESKEPETYSQSIKTSRPLPRF